MSLGYKKANGIFNKLSKLYLIVFATQFLSFSFLDYSRKQKQVEEISYLNHKSGGTQTSVNERDFFCIISDCRNLFNNKLKKTYYQAKSFFILANTQSSLEEYLIKEKCKTFIGMCSLFTWLKMQVLNLYHRRHRRIQNSLKYIKQSVLRKYLTDKSY